MTFLKTVCKIPSSSSGVYDPLGTDGQHSSATVATRLKKGNTFIDLAHFVLVFLAKEKITTYILCLGFALGPFRSHKVKNEQPSQEQGVPAGNNSVSRNNVAKCVSTI